MQIYAIGGTQMTFFYLLETILVHNLEPCEMKSWFALLVAYIGWLYSLGKFLLLYVHNRMAKYVEKIIFVNLISVRYFPNGIDVVISCKIGVSVLPFEQL